MHLEFNWFCIKSSMRFYHCFSGLPEKEDLTIADIPSISIIDVLCQLFEGLAIETKIIRRQYLGSLIEELIGNEVIFEILSIRFLSLKSFFIAYKEMSGIKNLLFFFATEKKNKQ